MLGLWEKIKKHKIGIFLVLYFLPLLIFPNVYSGDEPHYLLVTSSLVKDHDFDLNNNYFNVWQKGNDAGGNFAGQILDHHTVFVNKENKEVVFWDKIFQLGPGGMEAKDKEFIQTFKPQNYHERSFRAVGMPLVAAIMAFPFHYFIGLEFLVLLITKIIFLIALYYLYKIAFHFTQDKNLSLVMTGVFALCSPLWHYSKTFFVEPYLASLIIIVYYLLLKNKLPWLQGWLLGLGVLFKNQFILVPVGVALFKLKQKKIKDFIFFSIPILIFCLVQAGMNYYFYKQFQPVQQFLWGNPLINLWHLFFGFDFGLLPKMPFYIFGALGISYFVKIYLDEFKKFFILFATFLLPVAFWQIWDGGYSYPPRLIVPLLPLFLPPIIIWYQRNKNQMLKYAFWILVFYSFIINAHSVFAAPVKVWLPFSLMIRYII